MPFHIWGMQSYCICLHCTCTLKNKGHPLNKLTRQFKILLVYYVWNASEIIKRTWHAENVLIHHVNFVGYFLTVEIVNIAIWCPIDIYPYITYYLVERHALHSVLFCTVKSYFQKQLHLFPPLHSLAPLFYFFRCFPLWTIFSLLSKVSWEYKFEKAYVPMTVKMFLAYRVKVSFWHFNDMVWKNVFNYRIFKGHTLCENPNWQNFFSMCKLSHTNLFWKTHMMINLGVSSKFQNKYCLYKL